MQVSGTETGLHVETETEVLRNAQLGFPDTNSCPQALPARPEILVLSSSPLTLTEASSQHLWAFQDSGRCHLPWVAPLILLAPLAPWTSVYLLSRALAR